MKYLLKILTVIAVVAMVSSCNDVLDNTQPSTSVSQGQALSTPNSIAAIRTGMFNRLHGFYYTTQYFLAPSALADGLVNRAGGSNRFNAQVTNVPGAIAGTWTGIGSSVGSGGLAAGNSYDIINDANLLINAIPDGVLDDATLAQYRGEAFFMRAFAYHHLVRDYGYEPGMTPNAGQGQGFDLGVILRLTPTLSPSDANFRPRSTVSAVYDQIISDLSNAISLLQTQQDGSTIFPTVAAAQAEMARVQLYARNYEEADTFATQALSNTGAQLVSGDAVASEFDETAGLNPEAIFVITTNPNTESIGVNNSLSTYTTRQFESLVPTQDLMDLYQPNDARLGWYGPCFDEQNNVATTGCLATNPGIDDGNTTLEINKWLAESNGQFADDLPFLRVPEMLLIQSEARLHTGGDALTPINTLRESRNINSLSSVDIDDILNERRREFAAEGQRYWDLKRLGRTIRKAPETTNATISDVPYTDFRILDQVPTGQVALSQQNAPQDSILVQNPGY